VLEQESLTKIVEKLEAIDTRIHAMQLSFTHDISALREGFRMELNQKNGELENRLDNTEKDVVRLKVIASGALFLAGVATAGLLGIFFSSFRIQPAGANDAKKAILELVWIKG
jgi:hypothetical protein